MRFEGDFSCTYSFRTPADPFPTPIQEPPDPPENPDVPVREPDPEDPGHILALPVKRYSEPPIADPLAALDTRIERGCEIAGPFASL